MSKVFFMRTSRDQTVDRFYTQHLGVSLDPEHRGYITIGEIDFALLWMNHLDGEADFLAGHVVDFESIDHGDRT